MRLYDLPNTLHNSEHYRKQVVGVAQGLMYRGLRRGDVVILFVRDPLFEEAALRAGGVLLPVDEGVSDEELQQLLVSTQPKMLLFANVAQQRRYAALCESSVKSLYKPLHFCLDEGNGISCNSTLAKQGSNHSNEEGLRRVDALAFVEEGLYEAAHLLGGEFLETLHRCGAVDGVDHQFAGAKLPHNLHPTLQHFGACGVEVGRA